MMSNQVSSGWSDTDLSKFTCELCGLQGLTDDAMKTHLRTVHIDNDTEVSCFFCDLGGVSPADMTIHINTVHCQEDCDTVHHSVVKHGNSPKDCQLAKDHTPCDYGSDMSPNKKTLSFTDSPPCAKQKPKTSTPLVALNSPSEGELNPAATRKHHCVQLTATDDGQTAEVFDLQKDRTLSSAVSGCKTSSHVTVTAADLDLNNQQMINHVVSADEVSVHQPSLSAVPHLSKHSCNHNCPLCVYVASSTDELSRHVDIAHNDILSPAKGGSFSARGGCGMVCQEDDILTCPVCGALGASESEMDLHFALQHGELHEAVDLQCPVCGDMLSDDQLLQLHVDEHYEQAARRNAVAEGVSDSYEAQLKERRQRESEKLLRQHQDEALSDGGGSGGMGIENTKNDAQCSSDRKPLSTKTLNIDRLYVDDMMTSTEGVIERLREMPVSGQVRARLLCSPTTHFVSDGNNCGFRNLQMLLSCLLHDPEFLRVVFTGQRLMPSVYRLQQLIEESWSAGFDPIGSMQLGGRLVKTRKWIGATEVVAVLSYLHVRCELFDFHHPSGPQNTHPRLLKWVRDYFRHGQGQFLPPLYFQHEGHSRTIVGIEEKFDGSVTLLIFDPGNHQMNKLLQQGDVMKLLNAVRRNASTIRKLQYQLVVVTGLLRPDEYEARKRVTSTRIP
jgi:hypothetical protein